jgi:hypothetical protein
MPIDKYKTLQPINVKHAFVSRMRETRKKVEHIMGLKANFTLQRSEIIAFFNCVAIKVNSVTRKSLCVWKLFLNTL